MTIIELYIIVINDDKKCSCCLLPRKSENDNYNNSNNNAKQYPHSVTSCQSLTDYQLDEIQLVVDDPSTNPHNYYVN